MKEIVFNNNTLQKSNRIKIPDVIIDSLKLKEGQPISIILDIEEECIKVIKKDRKKKKIR